MKPRWDWYGICKSGLILRGQIQGERPVGVTGIWTWRQIFSVRGSLLELKVRMAGALDGFIAQMTAPSKNQKRRMRQRLQS